MQKDGTAQEGLNRLRMRMRSLMASNGDWEGFALDVFRFQSRWNKSYARFVELRQVDVHSVQRVEDIPFLPVETFQRQPVTVLADDYAMNRTFRSSGTSGQTRSMHLIDEAAWYDEVAWKGWEHYFGNRSGTVFIGLLPGYLERGDSSLVHMVHHFMIRSGQSNPNDWFYLTDFALLEERLDTLNAAAEGNPTTVIIIGVTHALLRWASGGSRATRWPHLSLEIIETGGMKGHGPERIRAEVHEALQPLSTAGEVRSEYGMTEMLSQAWSANQGFFIAPPWMWILVGSLNDPGEWLDVGRQGRVHVVDLANLASCSFLATGDIGRNWADGRFEILGRYDFAEVRGCNLMTVD